MPRVIEMDRQRTHPVPEAMSTALSPSHYIGAFSEDRDRLTLVAIDPKDPWEAFRAVRRRLRRSNERVDIALYDAPQPVEHDAEIVVLRPRRAV